MKPKIKVSRKNKATTTSTEARISIDEINKALLKHLEDAIKKAEANFVSLDN